MRLIGCNADAEAWRSFGDTVDTILARGVVVSSPLAEIEIISRLAEELRSARQRRSGRCEHIGEWLGVDVLGVGAAMDGDSDTWLWDAVRLASNVPPPCAADILQWRTERAGFLIQAAAIVPNTQTIVPPLSSPEYAQCGDRFRLSRPAIIALAAQSRSSVGYVTDRRMPYDPREAFAPYGAAVGLFVAVVGHVYTMYDAAGRSQEPIGPCTVAVVASYPSDTYDETGAASSSVHQALRRCQTFLVEIPVLPEPIGASGAILLRAILNCLTVHDYGFRAVAVCGPRPPPDEAGFAGVTPSRVPVLFLPGRCPALLTDSLTRRHRLRTGLVVFRTGHIVHRGDWAGDGPDGGDGMVLLNNEWEIRTTFTASIAIARA